VLVVGGFTRHLVDLNGHKNVTFEFCKKEIYSRYIQAHWKTKRCLQKTRETRMAIVK
jgi:hypothetical protein